MLERPRHNLAPIYNAVILLHCVPAKFFLIGILNLLGQTKNRALTEYFSMLKYNPTPGEKEVIIWG